MQGLDFLFLIDGEFRSLIRNFFEKIIGEKMKKQDCKLRDIASKLSVRVVSSLIAIQLYGFLQKQDNGIKNIVSIVFVILFMYFFSKSQN